MISECPTLAPDASHRNKVLTFANQSSQAMDVGTLKSLPADTIRVLVWILSFMTFGYATAEFEVTSERLGVYRPEEHIEYGFALSAGPQASNR